MQISVKLLYNKFYNGTENDMVNFKSNDMEAGFFLFFCFGN
jgi:hypothetical protein